MSACGPRIVVASAAAMSLNSSISIDRKSREAALPSSHTDTRGEKILYPEVPRFGASVCGSGHWAAGIFLALEVDLHRRSRLTGGVETVEIGVFLPNADLAARLSNEIVGRPVLITLVECSFAGR